MAGQRKALVAFPLTGGLDTRSDPKMIAPPKLAALRDARFGQPGALRKRQGYAEIAPPFGTVFPGAGTTVAIAPRSLAVRGQELLASDGLRLWSRRVNDDGALPWFTNPGMRCSPMAIEGTEVGPDDGIYDCTSPDGATVNGITVRAFESQGGTLLFVYDATGTVLTGPLALPNAGGGIAPRVLVVGDVICIFFALVSDTTLRMRIIDTVTHFPLNANTNPFVDFTIASDLNAANPAYDVAVSEGRILVVYNTSTANTLKFGYVEARGALDGALTTQATASAPVVCSCTVRASDGLFLLLWGSDAGTRLDGRVFSKDGTAVAAAANFSLATTGYRHVTAIWNAAVSRFSVFFEISAAATYNNFVQRASIGADGVVDLATGGIMLHSGLASKPWSTDGTDGSVHVLLVHDSLLQGSYFVVNFYGSLTEGGVVQGALLKGQAGGLITRKSCLPQPQLVGSKYVWQGLKKTRLGKTSTFSARSIVELRIDHSLAPHAQAFGEVMILPGAQLFQYDGQRVSEVGFHLYPENIAAVSSNAAGALVAGKTYSYRFYFEALGPAGRERSFAVAFQFTVGGGHNTVTLDVPTLMHTMRMRGGGLSPLQQVLIVGYRTDGDGGNIFYRITDPNPTVGGDNGFEANVVIANTVTVVDKMSDAVLVTKEPDVFADGSVLEAVSPPAHSLLAAGNNRVFLAGIPGRPNEVWFSKERDTGEPLEFNEVLQLVVDDDGGQPITALTVERETLYVFRESRIYMVGIDLLPDAGGTGGEATTPRLIAQDLGCANPRSLVRIPQGWVFQSARGLYLLAGEGPQYLGADVERYNSEAVVSACTVPSIHEARFLTANRCLVFEYLVGQWTEWTIAGLDAVVWQDRFTYLPSATGAVRSETAGAYKDPGNKGYQMVVQVPPVNLGAKQGYQALRRILVLGELKSAHALRVTLAYNFGGFVEEHQVDAAAVVKAVTGASASPVLGTSPSDRPATDLYQFEIRPKRHRCQTIEVRIEDVTRDGLAVGEGFTLREVAYEIALLPGVARIRADKRA